MFLIQTDSDAGGPDGAVLAAVKMQTNDSGKQKLKKTRRIHFLKTIFCYF